MIAHFKTWSDLWVGSGLGLLLVPCVLIAFGWQEISELENLDATQGSRFSAVVSRQGKTFVFDTAGKSRISCFADHCGYPDANLDIGVPRNYVMAGGWLLSVERDGTFIDVRSTTLHRKRGSLRFGAMLAALSLPCFVLAYVMRGSPLPARLQSKAKISKP
ncbi:hypothetical protein ACG04R_07840 [Roseateles sp. BYS78W]|uniref:DUF3592 domain-containing protein n=1 Tax=Pelomonas candidula TaxID=3299025 RepID=A0ABW7H9I7_9BURK